MIPWIREKFAERLARWFVSRKRENNRSNGSTSTISSNSLTFSPSNSSAGHSRSRHISFPQHVNGRNNQTSTVILTNNDNISETSSDNSSIDFTKQNLTTAFCCRNGNSNQNNRQSPEDEPLNEENNSEAVALNNEVSVRVISPRGGVVVVSIDKKCTGEDLKKIALDQFISVYDALPHFATDVKNLLNKYKLIRVKQRTLFDESLSLLALNVTDEDEFVLAVKRVDIVLDEESIAGPTVEEIALATKDIPIACTAPPRANITNTVYQNDLQLEMRKILISLAQSSAYIIGAGPYAERLIIMLKQKLINKRRHEADTVQCLVDMGFPRTRVIHALLLKNDVYSAALDWLIENQSKPNLLIDDLHQSSSLSQKFNTKTPRENIEALLEIIRIYSARNIPASSEMIASITDMGFSESEAREALKATRNNKPAACEWLIGNRSRSLTELCDGLPADSPVLKALLSSPQVQLSLSNPKMFIAYLSMLENYQSLGMWLGDVDTSSIIGLILRTYHEEKNFAVINQFTIIPSNLQH